jgi:hypothetical protein
VILGKGRGRRTTRAFLKWRISETRRPLLPLTQVSLSPSLFSSRASLCSTLPFLPLPSRFSVFSPRRFFAYSFSPPVFVIALQLLSLSPLASSVVPSFCSLSAPQCSGSVRSRSRLFREGRKRKRKLPPHTTRYWERCVASLMKAGRGGGRRSGKRRRNGVGKEERGGKGQKGVLQYCNARASAELDNVERGKRTFIPLTQIPLTRARSFSSLLSILFVLRGTASVSRVGRSGPPSIDVGSCSLSTVSERMDDTTSAGEASRKTDLTEEGREVRRSSAQQSQRGPWYS